MEINSENDFYIALELSDKEYLELFDIFVQELAVFNEQIKETWRSNMASGLYSHSFLNDSGSHLQT